MQSQFPATVECYQHESREVQLQDSCQYDLKDCQISCPPSVMAECVKATGCTFSGDPDIDILSVSKPKPGTPYRTNSLLFLDQSDLQTGVIDSPIVVMGDVQYDTTTFPNTQHLICTGFTHSEYSPSDDLRALRNSSYTIPLVTVSYRWCTYTERNDWFYDSHYVYTDDGYKDLRDKIPDVTSLVYLSSLTGDSPDIPPRELWRVEGSQRARLARST